MSLFYRTTKLVSFSKSQIKCSFCPASFSTAATQTVQSEPIQHFRTLENNPINHSEQHVSRFYVIPQKVKDTLFVHGGIPRSLNIQMKTFREAAIMVRDPAVEIISILNKFNFTNPALRFILYGVNGTGKTTTLMHLLHYGYESKFLLVHHPWGSIWTKTPKEKVDSQYKERRIDLPIESALWLQLFKTQNLPLLQELDLRVSKSYTWSKREVTEQGAPLLDVIEHGLARVRHSSDCIAVLQKEIKHHSQFGKFKTLVIIDGVNAFYSKTNVMRADKTLALADDLTVVHATKKLLNNDWNNAAVITSVDVLPYNRDATMQDPCTPRHLLGKEGFELLDPFIPIQIKNFTEKEIDNVLDYYCDRLWIQSEFARSEEGRKQLKFLSGYNPFILRKLCDPL